MGRRKRRVGKRRGQPLAAFFCAKKKRLGNFHHQGAAGFVDDAKGTLTLRNFFINRDFKGDNATRGKAEEWTQNFILDFRSGYTEGPLGFGVDVLGLYSQKLDGGKGTGGTQLLPLGRDGKPADHSGKMKLSETELRVGEWYLVLPILRADNGRSLPQTFQGSMLTSQDIRNLTLYAGHITGNSPRDDRSMEDMTLFGTSPYTSDRKSDDYNFAAIGVSGLTFMTRYISGHNIHVGAV
ncbi:hypothetical protein GCM10027398_21280 [Azotobacter salinestris]